MQPGFVSDSLNNSIHLQELRQVIFRRFIYATTTILTFVHIWTTAYWLDLMDWRSWYATLGLLALAGISLGTLDRQPRLAHILWHGGLLLLLMAAIYWLEAPALLGFLVLLPLMTIITSGLRAGLLLWLGMAALIWWGGAWLMPMEFSMRGIFILAGLVSGAIGWILVSSLFLAVHWAMMSFEQATRNVTAAREHRAQLMSLYKSLDQAYYQLERTNAALVAAWKTIEEAERFKSEFVAHVSHELRTPLNLIVGFSEMMMTSPESYGGIPIPNRYRSDLNTIARNAQHLLALADDVLDLTRIEIGKIALAREDVDLAELIRDVTGMLREYVMVKGLELQIHIAPNLPSVWIDRLRIRQVLLNLLTNAARHTEQGKLEIAVTCANDEIVVRVIDTGQGIAPHVLDRLFVEFETSLGAHARRSSGVGLGLPISRKFIELHGGRMGAESTVGQGACFWFALPIVATRSEAQPKSVFAARQPAARLSDSERIVVLIHQDPRIASLLKRYLDGYQVIQAATPAEGVRLATEIKAIALVSAQSEDTLDSVSDLPADMLHIHCPLPSSQASADAVGAADLLTKPISRQELLAAVDRVGGSIERVLIVDDEPEMVRLCRKMLRGRVPPQACLEAYDGINALEILKRESVDLLVLDLAMPQMDGRQLLAHMSGDPQLAQIPVILISGTGQDQIKVDLPGEIRISRAANLALGDIVLTLNAIFNALTPGWQPSRATAPKPGAGQPESPAWPENRLHPKPMQAGAR